MNLVPGDDGIFWCLLLCSLLYEAGRGPGCHPWHWFVTYFQSLKNKDKETSFMVLFFSPFLFCFVLSEYRFSLVQASLSLPTLLQHHPWKVISTEKRPVTLLCQHRTPFTVRHRQSPVHRRDSGHVHSVSAKSLHDHQDTVRVATGR